MRLQLRCEGSEGVGQRKRGRAKHGGKRKLVEGEASAKALRWPSALWIRSVNLDLRI